MLIQKKNISKLLSIPSWNCGSAYVLTNRISHLTVFPSSIYTAKKCKISCLSGLELEMSLTQLHKLQKILIPNEIPESDTILTNILSDRLDNIIALLESQVNDLLI